MVEETEPVVAGGDRLLCLAQHPIGLQVEADVKGIQLNPLFPVIDGHRRKVTLFQQFARLLRREAGNVDVGDGHIGREEGARLLVLEKLVPQVKGEADEQQPEQRPLYFCL